MQDDHTQIMSPADGGTEDSAPARAVTATRAALVDALRATAAASMRLDDADVAMERLTAAAYTAGVEAQKAAEAVRAALHRAGNALRAERGGAKQWQRQAGREAVETYLDCLVSRVRADRASQAAARLVAAQQEEREAAAATHATAVGVVDAARRAHEEELHRYLDWKATR